jgi:hypothetical protein
VGPQVLLPLGAGLVLEQVQLRGEIVHLLVRLATTGASCPSCRCWSGAFHSSYRREIADLPIADRQVVVHLQVRRFRCREPSCLRCTFVEQVPLLVERDARRTRRLRADLEEIGLALGGRPGVRVSTRAPLRHDSDRREWPPGHRPAGGPVRRRARWLVNPTPWCRDHLSRPRVLGEIPVSNDRATARRHLVMANQVIGLVGALRLQDRPSGRGIGVGWILGDELACQPAAGSHFGSQCDVHPEPLAHRTKARCRPWRNRANRCPGPQGPAAPSLPCPASERSRRSRPWLAHFHPLKRSRDCTSGRRYVGSMFGFSRKKFAGSYFRLSATSRSYVPGRYPARISCAESAPCPLT